jgi:hypothetical protein
MICERLRRPTRDGQRDRHGDPGGDNQRGVSGASSTIDAVIANQAAHGGGTNRKLHGGFGAQPALGDDSATES